MNNRKKLREAILKTISKDSQKLDLVPAIVISIDKQSETHVMIMEGTPTTMVITLLEQTLKGAKEALV